MFKFTQKSSRDAGRAVGIAALVVVVAGWCARDAYTQVYPSGQTPTSGAPEPSPPGGPDTQPGATYPGAATAVAPYVGGPAQGGSPGGRAPGGGGTGGNVPGGAAGGAQTPGGKHGSTLYPMARGYQKTPAYPKPDRTIKAHVVALDQPFMWNRLGASQPSAMIYALAQDVVPTDYDPSTHAPPPAFNTYVPGDVRLREDRRPRPLVLRVSEGELLEVTFTNLLGPVPVSPQSGGLQNGAPTTRYAGFHVNGLELYQDGGIGNDSSWAGVNPAVNPSSTQPNYKVPDPKDGGEPASLCAPGATKVYRLYAKSEGTFLVDGMSADAPNPLQISQLQAGLFGAVHVQPEQAEFYRSQVTRADLDLATFYLDDVSENRLVAERTRIASLTAKASRISAAKATTVYLPEQPGVFKLNPPNPTPTNMQLTVELDEQTAQPRTVDLNGTSFRVYTLTTVVPSPPKDHQQRTLKTTSVILIERPGDMPGRKRLYLVNGQHLVNYLAVYDDAGQYPSGQPIPAGTPVLSMLKPPPFPVRGQDPPEFELVSGELTAIITGPNHDRWPYSITGPSFNQNPSSPDRRQPYREFTIIYHYTFGSVQAFPPLGLQQYAVAGGDYFGINYGSAGIGAEILANRLGVGPMGGKDAVDLKFEEFFLSSWACGDPAMVVDRPANAPNQTVTDPAHGAQIIKVFDPVPAAPLVADLDNGNVPADFVTKFNNHVPPITLPTTPTASVIKKQEMWTIVDNAGNQYTVVNKLINGTAMLVVTTSFPPALQPLAAGKATKAFYPDDPSNVYHSYMRDHVKFRVLNASENITHVHHQHAHQWLHTPNSDNGQYLDSQTVVAGSGYTMEITHGGSGNLNYTVGDSIFHCHFYPHFAEGMWSLWRVHDVYEAGTKLDAHGIPLSGVGPDDWNRALPDAEISTGTPIPGLVPMPSLAMAPLPSRVRLIDNGRRVEVEIQNQKAIAAAKTANPANPANWPAPAYENPGYPYFIPAVAGHRPPHPPLDYAWKEDQYGNPETDPKTGERIYLDGGLPRHQVLDGDLVRNLFTRWDFSKDFVDVGPGPAYDAIAGGLVAFELPQKGTPVEKAAMKTHSTRARAAFMPNGDPGNFILNGLPGVPGAPYAPPGVRGDGESNVNVRRYKAAVLQLDVVLNKKGWHFPQQRLLTLWDDVAPTVTGVRAPQPFFFRSNTDDTIEYWHTNLVPNYYEMDDFQVRTPTDVLGQHIHLVKFDVTSSDGAGNGFNYEDGTFSPQEVRERIAAVNAKGGLFAFDPVTQFKGTTQRKLTVVPVNEGYPLEGDPKKGSLFGQPPPFQNWDGAQTTIQRFDTDPTLNNEGLDRTVRSVFTHDHFSPSTHQQAGYYAALLVEPDSSTWEIPVITPNGMNQPTVVYKHVGDDNRRDGGPTSWQANIITADPDESYREFAIEFQDMQLAYLAPSTTVPQTPSQFRIAATSPRPFVLGAAAQAELQTLKVGDKIPAGATDPIRVDFQNNGITLSALAVVAAPPTGVGFQFDDPGGPATLAAYSIDPSFNVVTLVSAGSLFTLLPPATTELATQVGKTVPPGSNDPIRSQLLTAGIELSDLATVENGTPPFKFQINDKRKDVNGNVIITERYPIDGSFGLYTPDIAPGWADPPNKIAAPGNSRINPTPQLISFGTIGTYSVGYRNEPLPLRVATAVNNQPQATDLAYGYASIPRGDSELNVQPAFFTIDLALKGVLAPPPPGGAVPAAVIQAFKNAGVTLNTMPPPQLIFNAASNEWVVVDTNIAGTNQVNYVIRELAPPLPANLYVFTTVPFTKRVFPAPLVPLSTDPGDGGVTGPDPYTPMLRAYANDRVQVRALAGAHMNEHSFTIHGVKYFFEPSYTDSGYQNTQAISLSEHFEMAFTVPAKTATQTRTFADFLYAASSNAQGQTSGAWGILRGYDGPAGPLGMPDSPTYLNTLPSNTAGHAPKTVDFAAEFAAAPLSRKREYTVIATTAAQILPDASLYYNSRGQATANFPFKAQDHDKTRLENPYALLYVNADDLDPGGKLQPDRRIEPLILRANAGDWIKINLINQFNPAEPTFGNQNGIGVFPAGNPFMRLAKVAPPGTTALTLSTSTSVGLHPQLVEYDITASDGMNVGYNPQATINPGGGQTLYWFAGNLEFEGNKLVATPVELGSVNLAPADPLVQHRKGLIGALVVEPEGSTWPSDPAQLELVTEYEYVYDPMTTDGTVKTITPVQRKTRAVATVTPAEGEPFRELVVVMQTDALMYQKNNPKRSSSPAFNYRSEPLQYRYAGGYGANPFAASFPAGTAARVSNALVSPDFVGFQPQMADPQTPVLTAKAGKPVRFRWIYPVGPGGDAGGSSQVPVVHGHLFQEEPFLNDSTELGFNPLSEWMGGRFILPGQTIDMLFSSAGGSFNVPGDYFYGTFVGQSIQGGDASGGNTQAIWGLMRVAK
jgi:hypothetical protein